MNHNNIKDEEGAESNLIPLEDRLLQDLANPTSSVQLEPGIITYNIISIAYKYIICKLYNI